MVPNGSSECDRQYISYSSGYPYMAFAIEIIIQRVSFVKGFSVNPGSGNPPGASINLVNSIEELKLKGKQSDSTLYGILA